MLFVALAGPHESCVSNNRGVRQMNNEVMSNRNIRSQLLKPPQFAALLNVEVGFIYKRTKRTAKDPIPRCPGYGRLMFNPRDPKLQAWVERNFGPLDLVSIAAGLIDTEAAGA